MEALVAVLFYLLGGSVCIFVVFMIFAVGKKYAKRDKIPVRCLNCGTVVSHGRWRKNDGCITCGSDLFELQHRL